MWSRSCILGIGLCILGVGLAAWPIADARAGQRRVPETYDATDSSAGVAPTGNQSPLPITATYDDVPIEQTDAFLKRLRLVSQILQQYGRAYDYRIHTVRELEAILARLNQTSLNEATPTESRSIRVMPSVPPIPMSVPKAQQSPQSNTNSNPGAQDDSRLEPLLQPGTESDSNSY
jgi:hypothetical protein